MMIWGVTREQCLNEISEARAYLALTRKVDPRKPLFPSERDINRYKAPLACCTDTVLLEIYRREILQEQGIPHITNKSARKLRVICPQARK